MVVGRRFLLVGLVSLVLLSCSDRIADETSQDTLRVGCYIPGELESLDPISGLSAASPLVDLVFNGLVQVNDSLLVVPDLAASWEVSGDALTWTFHLRKGVVFHDGIGCTAADVKFTLDLLMDPASGSPLRSAFRQVKDVEVMDRHTVAIHLSEPHAPLLASLNAPILPKHMLEGRQIPNAEFNCCPTGTGPFRLARWNSDKQLLFEANERYFKGVPKLARIVVTVYTDPRSLWVDLMKGVVDVASRLPADLLDTVSEDVRLQTHAGNFSFYYLLLYNLRRPFFSGRKVRQAISCAIDRDALIKAALCGQGVAATGPFLPGTWPCNPEIAPTHYDPDRSLDLLRQAGWNDLDGEGVLRKDTQPFEFTLLIDQGNRMKQMAAGIMRLQLDEIGVRMKVEALPLPILMEYMRSGSFDACFAQVNPGLDPDLATLVWASKGTFNFGSYENQQVDALLNEGRAKHSREQRRKTYHEVHRLLAEHCPAAFLFCPKVLAGCSVKMKGIANISATDLFYGVEAWTLSEERGGEAP